MTLRHVSRQFPDQFARALLPLGSAIASATWLDTQVTARQRRLDRALDVIADGARRLLHAEWQLGMEADVPFRLYEYHVLLALTAAAESVFWRRAPAHREPAGAALWPGGALARRGRVPHLAARRALQRRALPHRAGLPANGGRAASARQPPVAHLRPAGHRRG